MKLKLGELGVMALIVGFIWTMSVTEAKAMPTFARKHKTSCSTCHSAPPRLNAFGEAYRMNGYKMPDLATKEAPVVMMQEAYGKADLSKRSALFPSDLPGASTLSFRFMYDYKVDQGGVQPVANDFNYVHEAEMVTLGSLGDKFAFFGEVELEREAGAMAVGTSGWFQIEDLFMKENMVNVKAGSFMPAAVPIVDDHNRLTKTHYLYGAWQMPTPGAGPVNAWKMEDMQSGLEIHGFQDQWHYAVGLVNGNSDNEDNNTHKDFYVLFRYKLGGMKYTESGTSGEVKPEEGYQIHRDTSVQLGAFYYSGKAAVGGSTATTDSFYRAGFDVKANQGKVQGTLGYIQGRHTNPWGILGNEAVDTTDMFVEGEYAFYPWMIGGLRYESLAWGEPSAAQMTALGLVDQDQSRLVTSVSTLLANNVRLLVELKTAMTDKTLTEVGSKKNENDGLYFRIDFAF